MTRTPCPFHLGELAGRWCPRCHGAAEATRAELDAYFATNRAPRAPISAERIQIARDLMSRGSTVAQAAAVLGVEYIHLRRAMEAARVAASRAPKAAPSGPHKAMLPKAGTGAARRKYHAERGGFASRGTGER